MADINEIDDPKEEKKKSRREKKKEKKQKAQQENDQDTEEPEKASSKIVMALVTILIIVIWLGIFAILIKSDVGGFGSTVLAPALKNVPVINRILPDTGEAASTENSQDAGYNNLDDAVARIKELEVELDTANSQIEQDSQTIDDLNSQVADLSSYKEDQAAFEEEKEKYYEEVVFSDNAPDIKEYKAYYESIDPANAEVLYKQVCEELQQDDQIKDYADTYSKMKPKEAAAIFDSMTDNLQLVARILNAMDSQSRGNILGKMDADTAAKVTKIMNPSQN
ncbi:MotE family protein [Agathobacter sp.]